MALRLQADLSEGKKGQRATNGASGKKRVLGVALLHGWSAAPSPPALGIN